jgi:hypothetical protein
MIRKQLEQCSNDLDTRFGVVDHDQCRIRSIDQRAKDATSRIIGAGLEETAFPPVLGKPLE